jgi:hypothetical protein
MHQRTPRTTTPGRVPSSGSHGLMESVGTNEGLMKISSTSRM